MIKSLEAFATFTVGVFFIFYGVTKHFEHYELLKALAYSVPTELFLTLIWARFHSLLYFRRG